MLSRFLLVSACTLPITVQAATQIAQSVITTAGQSDQNTLCPPNVTEPYPQQFTWAFANLRLRPRGATQSDNLTPRVEQWHAGAAAASVVWSGLDSNQSTCQQPFLPPTAPPGTVVTFNGASYPYITIKLPNGNAEPIFSDPLLQAIANTGCGPFGTVSHSDLFRTWRSGDTFKIYPAVYPGIIQIHPKPDYYNGGTVPIFAPTDITLQGITVKGIHPSFLRTDAGGGDSESPKDVVEIAESSNVTIDNVDIGLSPTGYVALGVVFDTGGGSLWHDANGTALAAPIFGGTTTISNSRIFGGELAQQTSGGANGVVGAVGVLGGSVALLHDEIYQNGGSSVQNSGGPGHNVYLPTGLDPKFTVIAQGNWSHDAYYGHLFKTRAQNNIIVGNYFQGGVPQGGIYQQAEAYGLDVPNGGILEVKNNLFAKNESGPNSNGFSMAYGEEGIPDARPLSIDVENNTFVAFSATLDGFHPNVPFLLFSANQNPTIGGFPIPSSDVKIQHNAFVGYCPNMWTGGENYLGDVSATEGFRELTQQFRLRRKFEPVGDASIVGAPAYGHINLTLHREVPTIGAKD